MSKEVMQPSLTNLESLKTFSKELKNFIVTQKLYVNIQGKNYVEVEGWMFAGGSLGLVAVVRTCSKLDRNEDFTFKDKGGNDVTLKEMAYESWVDIYSGEKIVSSGFAMCSNKEAKKRTFDEYAVASMAQTRAIGKAYRMLLGWLMKQAGYESTTAEEMDESYVEQPMRGNDIPTYCADCGEKMVEYVKGDKKGQLHCLGKNSFPGQKPACPPSEILESDQKIIDELDAIPYPVKVDSSNIPTIKAKK